MVIYADVMLFMSSLMLFAAYGVVALLSGFRVGVLRLATGAFAVSVLGVAAVLYCKFAYVLLVPLVMLGTYLCLGVKLLRQNVKCSTLAFAAALLMGGVKYAFNVNAVLCIAVLYACALAVRRHTVGGQILSELEVHRGDISVRLTALVDTGNELRGNDRESVIVARRKSVQPLFTDADTDLRLLPFCSVGNNGVLVGVRCDYVLVNGVKRDGVIVAAVDSLGGAAYNALIAPELNAI